MSKPSGEAPTCPDCHSVMIWENKRPRTQRPQYRWRCGRCRYLSAAHKMTSADYRQLAAAQDDVCAICGTDTSTLVIDHDHGCCPPNRSCHKCRRGLLCNTCNRMIGLGFDDPMVMVHAAVYLLTVGTA